MRGILITSDNCEPCVELKDKFKDMIESGEVEEKKLETDGEEVAALMEKFEVGLPSFLILDNNGNLVLSI